MNYFNQFDNYGNILILSIGIMLQIICSKSKISFVIYSNVDMVNVIAKIEESTGKTQWAKAVINEYYMINFYIIDSEVVGENIWVSLFFI